MATFADPGFKLHTAMGQWLSLIAYHIADDVIIPWDIPNAAKVLHSYYDELDDAVADDYPDFDTTAIEAAIAEFETQATRITEVARMALAANDEVLIKMINSKYRDFSRGFASAGGLPGRETFRNVISAPGIDNGYGADVFPAVQDSLNAGDLMGAAEWVGKSTQAILRAAEILQI